MITVLAFVIVFLFAYLVLNAFVTVPGPVELRLRTLDAFTHRRSDSDEELAKPFSQRIFSPFTGRMAARVMKFTPYAIRRMVDEKLAMLGGFGGLGTDGFLLACGVLGVLLPVIVIIFGGLTGMPANKILGIAMIAFVLGLVLPFLLLNQKITARKLGIQRALPDVLDLLTVSVEAGLGFDGALAKLAEKMKGVLVAEFNRLLQEIRLGVTRRDALAAMALRCDVPDLALFTTSLIQADQLGVSIGNVLRVQSSSMREKRKQRAEERGMKAPIKMMLPLVLFIFPTIFIVILGPAVIQVLEILSHK
jgi:tight adherence protein C